MSKKYFAKELKDFCCQRSEESRQKLLEELQDQGVEVKDRYIGSANIMTSLQLINKIKAKAALLVAYDKLGGTDTSVPYMMIAGILSCSAERALDSMLAEEEETTGIPLENEGKMDYRQEMKEMIRQAEQFYQDWINDGEESWL